jgi:Aspartyl protease
MFLKLFPSTLLLLVLLAQFPGAAIAQQMMEPTPAIEAQEIPFEYANGYLLSVRGSIGARKNLKFLVDFGTTYTILDRHFVNETNPGGEGLDVAHFSSSVRTTDVVLPEFAIGPITMKDFHALVADLSEMDMPPNTAGVIGLDILRLRNLTIDFAQQKLVFSSTISGRHQAPLEKCLVGLAVKASWKGSPVKLAISTGVEVITLDQNRIEQGSYKLPKLTRGTVNSDFTVTPVAFFETKGMVLDDTGLQGPGVLRKMQWPAESDRLDGFLPLVALGSNRVSIDFGRHLLLWDDPTPLKQSTSAVRNSFSATGKNQ